MLGDWIQIAACISVVPLIALLVIEIANTPKLTGSKQKNPFNEEARQAHLGRIPAEVTSEVTKQRQSELQNFVAQNCSACHGVTGGIGPALSKANLEHLSVNAVTFTILYGRPAKGMPPWEAQLSETDAYWIAEFLIRRPAATL